MNANRIPEILNALGRLLEQVNEADWARACKQLATDYERDPQTARRSILALYGGMGSFNDLVVYDEAGRVLVDENESLDKLRSMLHEECRREI